MNASLLNNMSVDELERLHNDDPFNIDIAQALIKKQAALIALSVLRSEVLETWVTREEYEALELTNDQQEEEIESLKAQINQLLEDTFLG